MDKKYSVFVSSTYTDLVAERKQVIDALLQMNCFPIGMEYFNAEDDTQWNIIKNLIKERTGGTGTCSATVRVGEN